MDPLENVNQKTDSAFGSLKHILEVLNYFIINKDLYLENNKVKAFGYFLGEKVVQNIYLKERPHNT